MTVELKARSLDQPDETRRPDRTTVEVVNMSGHSIGRFTFEPGWTWAGSIKPVAGTEHCEKEHVGYCVAGHMEVWQPDGTRITIRSGDAYVIPPGHDAEVVGDEEFVGIEFSSAATYAGAAELSSAHAQAVRSRSSGCTTAGCKGNARRPGEKSAWPATLSVRGSAPRPVTTRRTRRWR